MNRYKITVAYDGTNYSGWQIQPDAATVQSGLEHALNTVTGETIRVHGSGRTDSGVHAMGQVVHFDLAKPVVPAVLGVSLNAVLPRDIRVIKTCRTRHDFHARRSAVSKEYRYFIWNGDVVPPFLRLYRTHIRDRMDVNAMSEACAILLGRHDFASFTANPNRTVESTVRNLSMLKVQKRGCDLVISARSEGFLYKMMRSLAGFLIKVGEGVLKPDDGSVIMAGKKRTALVPTAPPEGLFLWKVFY